MAHCVTALRSQQRAIALPNQPVSAMAKADAACCPVVNLRLHAESITSTCGRRHAPQSTRILCRSCLMISAASALRHTYHAVHVTLFFASFPVVLLSIVCRLDPSSILTPTLHIFVLYLMFGLSQIICCGMLLFCFMQAQPCQSDPIKLIALQQRGSSLFDVRTVLCCSVATIARASDEMRNKIHVAAQCSMSQHGTSMLYVAALPLLQVLAMR